jgi:Holliday junction resolvase RusA-like endonuclease
MQKTSCVIDKPFSANQMYVPIARGRLIKSKKYNVWIDKNLPYIKENLSPAKMYPVVIEILVMANNQWKTKNDPDNLMKPIVDLLVRAEIIPDDTARYVEAVHVRYLMGYNEPIARISYEEIEP